MHTTGVPRAQLPSWQASPTVHASPSSHGVPSADAGLEHAPVNGSQRSSVHGSASLQSSAVPATHVPDDASQVSMPVQASPSSHSASMVQQSPTPMGQVAAPAP